MTWSEEAQELSMELAFWHLGQTNPSYPIAQLGKLTSEQVRRFRALAIMQLLGKGSSDLFLHHLMRSARAQARYLERVQAEHYGDLYFAASGRVDPLLDAIAANDFAVAQVLAQESALDLQPGEYEDDHHYARALHALVIEPVNVAAASAALEALAAFLDGEASARVSVLRAIIARDQAAFDEAFADFLRSYEDAIDKNRERGEFETGPVLAQRAVSVEGLALLRLAERARLHTELEYPYCPSLARRPLQAPFRGDDV